MIEFYLHCEGPPASFSRFHVPCAGFWANLSAMPKWLKWCLGLLLLPVVVAEAMAVGRVVMASGSADVVWIPLLAGGAAWLVIYLLLPKPLWIYVLGHELTHALWTWLFGGRVKQIKVSASGGHVVVSKNNFLIVLAPYFFPLYAVLVVLIFLLGNWLWGWQAYRLWFHLALGAACAFHLSLTWHILQNEQSDITSQGWLFSSVIIIFGNLAWLLLGVPLITGKPGWQQALAWWGHDLTVVWGWMRNAYIWAAAKMLTIHS